MLTTSPAELALAELVTAFTPLQLEIDHPRTPEQLRELWQIDCLAYGDHSLKFEPFLNWWQRYPMGSRCLLLEGRIVAGMGIYPLTHEQAQSFTAGQIAEGELQPMPEQDCESEGCADWYFSGLVIVPHFQNRGVVRRLIRLSVSEWMRSGHLRYPIALYSLGQTERGRKALELFGMRLTVPASRLPDELDLYQSHPENAVELRSHFQGW